MTGYQVFRGRHAARRRPTSTAHTLTGLSCGTQLRARGRGRSTAPATFGPARRDRARPRTATRRAERRHHRPGRRRHGRAAPIAVSATADDNDAVAGVQFKLDGAQPRRRGHEQSVHASTGTPRHRRRAAHTRSTAVARDASGNTATSAPVHRHGRQRRAPGTGLSPPTRFDDGAGHDRRRRVRATATPARSSARPGRPGSSGRPSRFDGIERPRRPAGARHLLPRRLHVRGLGRRRDAKRDVGDRRLVGRQQRRPDDLGRPRHRPLLLTLGTASANYLDSGHAGRRPMAARRSHLRRRRRALLRRRRRGREQSFTGNVGDSNSWRIGAYGSSGRRVLRRPDRRRPHLRPRAQRRAEIQADMATPRRRHHSADGDSRRRPEAGATGVSVGTDASPRRSARRWIAATINATTFAAARRRRTRSSRPRVTYDAGDRARRR